MNLEDVCTLEPRQQPTRTPALVQLMMDKMKIKADEEDKYHQDLFRPYMREYDDVMEILGSNDWSVVDHLAETFLIEDKEEDGPKGPRCTFADFKLDQNGVKVPREIVFTDPDEFCMEQRVDYIFEMRKHG